MNRILQALALLLAMTASAAAGVPDSAGNPVYNAVTVNNTGSFGGLAVTNSALVGTDQSPGAFGTPVMIVGTPVGTQDALVGEVTNGLTSSTLAFPTGTSGACFLPTTAASNFCFGLYGVSELHATNGGVAIAEEVTARNFSGNNPDTGLPPSQALGTTSSVANGLNVTCGTETNTKDCSTGIIVSSESGTYSAPAFSNGMDIALFRDYGIAVNSQTSGNQTDLLLQNNGAGTPLEIQITGTATPTDGIINAFDENNNPIYNVRQDGDIYNYGRNELSGRTPTVTSCGSSPAVHSSHDQAGIITVGSGTVTACTVNFSQSFNNIPSCVVASEAGGIQLFILNKAVSYLEVSSVSSTNMAGYNFDYHCTDQ